MSKVYDAAYKLFFSNQTLFRQLLETFVAQDWIKQLDFSQCQKLEKSFISKRYRQTESDLIYQVQLRGTTAYICILLEFQSTVQRFMAIRVANYVTSFYLNLLDSHKKIKKLPPVFPIVLYSGKRKWTAPENTRLLITQPELIGRFALDFNYFKIDINELDQEKLLQAGNAVSYLFLSETEYRMDILAAELGNLFDKKEDKQALSLILNWFEQLAVHGKIEKIDFDKLNRVYSSKQEVDMIVDSVRKYKQTAFDEGKLEGKLEGIQQGIQQGFQQGVQQGIQQGVQQGTQQTKSELVRTMLHNQLDIALIVKITGLSESEILKLKNTSSH
jgi:predicted transposase/invertase (TIGR01784 family)